VARCTLRTFRGLRAFDLDDLISESIRISLEEHGDFREGGMAY
jgi:hypothetical protein